MKLFRIILFGLVFAVIAACTPMIYGVPQDRWDLMTEQERIAAMEAYKERQIAYQQAAAEQAKQKAQTGKANQEPSASPKSGGKKVVDSEDYEVK